MSRDQFLSMMAQANDTVLAIGWAVCVLVTVVLLFMSLAWLHDTIKKVREYNRGEMYREMADRYERDLKLAREEHASTVKGLKEKIATLEARTEYRDNHQADQSLS